MKVGDLVRLEYRGGDPTEQREKCLGIVIELYGNVAHPTLWLIHWSNGESQWVLAEQLKLVKKCP